MKNVIIAIVLFLLFQNPAVAQDQNPPQQKVMDGFPPSRESQVTFSNYRQHPFSQWSFRNAGAPMHILMMPRSGAVHAFKESQDAAIGKSIWIDTEGNSKTFESMFKDNYANGVIVIKNNTVLYENTGTDFRAIINTFCSPVRSQLPARHLESWLSKRKLTYQHRPHNTFRN